MRARARACRQILSFSLPLSLVGVRVRVKRNARGGLRVCWRHARREVEAAGGGAVSGGGRTDRSGLGVGSGERRRTQRRGRRGTPAA